MHHTRTFSPLPSLPSLTRELGTALVLQLRHHALLRVVGGAPCVQQTLREQVPVDLTEQVLVVDVREQGDDLAQMLLQLHLRQLVPARLQESVAVPEKSNIEIQCELRCQISVCNCS